MHPSVIAWAAEHSDEPVPLIIQHDGSPGEILSFVRASGGTVDREFEIIPAIDVSVPADRLPELARLDHVSWISVDAPVMSTGVPAGSPPAPVTTYPSSMNAPQAWLTTTGVGVTIAVIDSGVSSDARKDFSGGSRLQNYSPNPAYTADGDGLGHGTHVAGIAAGSSEAPQVAGKYVGIAPGANVLGVRIADDGGNATVGDLMAGLQYVDENREALNIRVLNLSVNSSIAQSYTVDPLDAAVEVLWFHGVTVVVASGNEGNVADAVHYPPANDPFVITVGAYDDKGTAGQSDDAVTSWSSRGTTQDGLIKPDVLGPGANIVAPISAGSYLALNYPEHIVEQVGNTAYFQMSGTSMATPTVVGLVALILEDHPAWTPGQIKSVLTQTGRPISGGGMGVLADAAVNFPGVPVSADGDLSPSYIVLNALGVAEADFQGVRWRDLEFNGVRWRGLDINGVTQEVDWTGVRWRGVEFNGVRWSGVDFTGVRWRGVRWRAFVEQDECNDAGDSCGLETEQVSCNITRNYSGSLTIPAGTVCTVTGAKVDGNIVVAGRLVLNDAKVKGNVDLKGGAVSGTGSVDGNLTCDSALGGTNVFTGKVKGSIRC